MVKFDGVTTFQKVDGATSIISCAPTGPARAMPTTVIESRLVGYAATLFGLAHKWWHKMGDPAENASYIFKISHDRRRLYIQGTADCADQNI